MTQKLFLMAGSLRKESVNKKLLKICADYLEKKQKIKAALTAINDFDLPLYNADDETATGIPKNAVKVTEHVISADGIIFAVPEYNGSTPGLFKNLVDWVSRIRPMPWAGKKILIVSASPSAYGGMRGFNHTRAPFEACNGFVYPRSFFLVDAYNAFTDDDQLKDSKLQERLELLLNGFLEF